MQDNLLLSKEVSELTGLSTSTIHRYADRGILKVAAYLRGGTRVFDKAAAEEFMNKIVSKKDNRGRLKVSTIRV